MSAQRYEWDRDPDRDLVRAAGAVLWRHRPAGVEFCLVHRPRYDDWSFPKGKVKPGEHVLQTVVREVEEETGHIPLLGRRLPSASYLKDGRPKRVDYWTATVREERPFTPDDEIDRIEWLPVQAAGRRLSYQHDDELLDETTRGPLRTVPYMMLRHGSAGDKRLWPDDDVLRPLDAEGRADAVSLARILVGFEPLRPISSATARCVETVLPYALHNDLSVVTDRSFTIGTSAPGSAADRMTELMAAGAPAMICTHGEIISDLVTGLCARPGVEEPDEPALRKGCFWILHTTASGLISLERYAAR